MPLSLATEPRNSSPARPMTRFTEHGPCCATCSTIWRRPWPARSSPVACMTGRSWWWTRRAKPGLQRPDQRTKRPGPGPAKPRAGRALRARVHGPGILDLDAESGYRVRWSVEWPEIIHPHGRERAIHNLYHFTDIGSGTRTCCSTRKAWSWRTAPVHPAVSGQKRGGPHS